MLFSCPTPTRSGNLVVYYFYSHFRSPCRFHVSYSSIWEASIAALWHFDYGVGNISADGTSLVGNKLLPSVTTNDYGYPTYAIPHGTPGEMIPLGENCEFVKSWVQHVDWDPRLMVAEIENDDDEPSGVILENWEQWREFYFGFYS